MSDSIMELQLLPFNDSDLADLYISRISDRELESVHTLFNETDWRLLFLDGILEKSYGQVKSISMLRAMALPFLVNIQSQKELGRLIKFDQRIQRVCGFEEDILPGFRSPWHFQNKYFEHYSDIMIRMLILLVLSGSEPRFDLPFVERVDHIPEFVKSNMVNVQFDPYRFDVEIYATSASGKPRTDPEINAWLEDSKQRIKKASEENDEQLYWKLLDQFELEKQGILKSRLLRVTNSNENDADEIQLPFPAYITTRLSNGKNIYFRLFEPMWEKTNALTLASFPSQKKIKKPYTTATLVLVPKKINGTEHILMSLRKDKGFGFGKWTLPGGKAEEKEPARKCADRELYEETGLTLLESRPVSFKESGIKGEPLVITVGVLATSYEGEVRTNEPGSHSSWEFKDLENLPSLIFEPASRVIKDYRNGTFSDIRWEDWEEYEMVSSSGSEENVSRVEKVSQEKLFDF